jgi:hypothetical protein
MGAAASGESGKEGHTSKAIPDVHSVSLHYIIADEFPSRWCLCQRSHGKALDGALSRSLSRGGVPWSHPGCGPRIVDARRLRARGRWLSMRIEVPNRGRMVMNIVVEIEWS